MNRCRSQNDHTACRITSPKQVDIRITRPCFRLWWVALKIEVNFRGMSLPKTVTSIGRISLSWIRRHVTQAMETHQLLPM